MADDFISLVRDAPQSELEQAVRELSRTELLQLVERTEDWADERESKYHLYSPVPVADPFHASPARIRAAFGGNRSSKTTSTMVDALGQLLGEFPQSMRPPAHRLRAPIFARWCCVDFVNGIEKIAYEALQKWCPPGRMTQFLKDLRTSRFDTGSQMEFMSYDQETASFGGTARHVIVHDEEPPKEKWNENLLRLVGVNGEVILAMTPTEGMTWVYDDIWLRAGVRTFKFKDLIRKTEFPEGDPNIHVFLYDTYDNPNLSEADISLVESLITDPEERKVRFHGEFLSFAGLVYKEFDHDVHIIDPFDIPLDWPVYAALDPHPRTENAYLMMAVDPKGRKFLFDEFFAHGDYDQLATMIRVKNGKHWMVRSVIDPWALIVDQLTQTSLINELAKPPRNCRFLPASKDRARGIVRVKEVLKYERKGDKITSPPSLYVFRTMKRFRWEMARYVWDDWKRHSDKNVKQTPRDKDDHMMENLYRLLLCDPRWFDKTETEAPQDDKWRWAS